MYADYDYYINEYKGLEIPEDEYNTLESRACDIIDILTSQRISQNDFNKYCEFIQKQVKKACAAQTEYLYQNGGIEFIADCGDIASISLGSFSIGSKNQNSQDNASNSKLISPLVFGHLALTGLLYRGVKVCM